MLQDRWGWFALPTNGVGDIGAQSADPNDPDQEIYTIYCEPIWLAWAADWEYERDRL